MIYIKRKASSNYFSIEGLFNAMEARVSKSFNIDFQYAKYSGASPNVILKNCLSFKRLNNVIYHITGDVHYMSIVSGKRTVLTIHDIKSAIKGSFFKRCYVKLFWFWLPALCVKRITVISEFTKSELIKVIPLSKHKIRVVYNPVSDLFKFQAYSFNEVCPRILCVGTKENKNLDRILDSVIDIPCKLHIIGKLNDSQLTKLDQNTIDYTNSYNLSQEAIVKAYRHCDILCFPSVYEGFGMPIIESQATGRPVITSNIDAMKEVAGNSACLVNPFDVNSIKNGILKIISDSDYRDYLVKEGLDNVKRFRLDSIVDQYINIYKEVIS